MDFFGDAEDISDGREKRKFPGVFRLYARM
jgi:hypothetical protein